ncbi:MAG: hypothetical protein ACOC7N_04860, partial [Chloroflexota bacterium]
YEPRNSAEAPTTDPGTALKRRLQTPGDSAGAPTTNPDSAGAPTTNPGRGVEAPTTNPGPALGRVVRTEGQR